MKLIITVIAVAILAPGLQAARINFDAIDQDVSIQMAKKTPIQNSAKLIKSEKIHKADNHPENIGCPSMNTLLNYVQKLNLDINEDLSKFNQTAFPKFAGILQNLAKQAEELEEQIKKADPKNTVLLREFLQQYYQIRNKFLPDHRALPYLQLFQVLKTNADQLREQIKTDADKLKTKKLDSLAEELTKDGKKLEEMSKGFTDDTDPTKIINKIKALQNYEHSLQKKLDDIENRIKLSSGSP